MSKQNKECSHNDQRHISDTEYWECLKCGERIKIYKCKELEE